MNSKNVLKIQERDILFVKSQNDIADCGVFDEIFNPIHIVNKCKSDFYIQQGTFKGKKPLVDLAAALSCVQIFNRWKRQKQHVRRFSGLLWPRGQHDYESCSHII